MAKQEVTLLAAVRMVPTASISHAQEVLEPSPTALEQRPPRHRRVWREAGAFPRWSVLETRVVLRPRPVANGSQKGVLWEQQQERKALSHLQRHHPGEIIRARSQGCVGVRGGLREVEVEVEAHRVEELALLNSLLRALKPRKSTHLNHHCSKHIVPLARLLGQSRAHAMQCARIMLPVASAPMALDATSSTQGSLELVWEARLSATAGQPRGSVSTNAVAISHTLKYVSMGAVACPKVMDASASSSTRTQARRERWKVHSTHHPQDLSSRSRTSSLLTVTLVLLMSSPGGRSGRSGALAA